MKYHIRRWHYLLGLLAAMWFILLSISGFLLNHTAELKLKQRFITNEWVLNYYGIKTDLITSGIKLNNNVWITHSKHSLFFNDQRLDYSIQHLQGALLFQDQFIVLLADNTLFLLTLKGELVEKLTYLPTDSQNIGKFEKNLILKTKEYYFSTDETFASWKPFENNDKTQFSNFEELPFLLKQQLNEQSRMGLLNIERILLDLHSGRIFGWWGVYVMDAMGLILLWLAGSGGWLWLKRQAAFKTK